MLKFLGRQLASFSIAGLFTPQSYSHASCVSYAFVNFLCIRPKTRRLNENIPTKKAFCEPVELSC